MDSLLTDNKNGLSQQKRRIPALFPENFCIDTKDTVSLLRYMYDLARNINFYNLKNEQKGNWQDFFLPNYKVLAALTLRLDTSKTMNHFTKLKAALQLAEKEETLFILLNDVFICFAEEIETIRYLRDQFANSYENTELSRNSVNQLAAFDMIFSKCSAAYHQIQDEFPGRLRKDSRIEQVPAYADYPHLFMRYGSVRQKVLLALDHLTPLFNAIRIQYSSFTGVLTYYLKGYDLLKDKQPPHLSLLLTFIKLYEHLQTEINLLPARHLDLYYKDILGLFPHLAKADHVYLLFEPEPRIHTLILEKGTELLAGISNQVPLIFTTSGNVSIQLAKVKKLRSFYVAQQSLTQRNTLHEVRSYYSENSVIRPEEYKPGFDPTSWAAMGEDQKHFSYHERSMTQAAFATVLSSPLLYLTEGERCITISIYLEEVSANTLDEFITKLVSAENGDQVQNREQVTFNLFSNAFLIEYTAENGWHKFTKYTFAYKNSGSDRFLEIKLVLSARESSFSLYKSSIHGSIEGIDQPAIKITINNDTQINPSSFLSAVQINRIILYAEAKGVTGISLSNQVGDLSHTTTFQPFGPQPLAGSFLDIRNSNIFNKYTREASITLEWTGLPELTGGWAEYYKAYNLQIKTTSFKVRIGAINYGKIWPEKENQQELPLFNTKYDSKGNEIVQDQTKLPGISLKNFRLSNQPLMDAERNYDPTILKQGAIRLELSSPPEGFGSRIYPQVYPEIVMHNNKRFVKKRAIPNPPYIPLVKTISIDYTLQISELINSKANQNLENRDLKLFHISPFGHKLTYPDPDKKNYSLFPPIDISRCLYIGIENAIPCTELSLLFLLDENTFLETICEEFALKWAYLHQNTWTYLGAANILEDSTNNLINTGIFKIRLPSEIDLTNTLLDPGIFWLRVSVDGFKEVTARIINIQTNAVKASRQLSATTTITSLILPPGSIEGFKNKTAGIKKIWQPFPSFSGIANETTEDFYVRISERLGHKQRPVTVSQIEQYILQEFPEIMMAKCISRKELATSQRAGPGITLKIVVIPMIQNQGLFTHEQPKVNIATLFRLHKLLERSIPAFIKVEVINPVYERIKIIASVSFKESELSKQTLLNKLDKDIRYYFCPWLGANVSEIKIGTKVYIAEILSFIKELSYISQISKFSVVHFYTETDPETGIKSHRANDLSGTEELFLKASTSGAIIIPSDLHLITVTDFNIYEPSVKIGISEMRIGSEFLIADTVVPAIRLPEIADTEQEDDFFSLTIGHF